MRKVIFTESQLKKILGEGNDMFLGDLDTAKQIPSTAYGDEVFTNVGNIENDEDPDVTVADKINKRRTRNNRLFARTRTYESVNESNFADSRSNNFGKKETDGIKSLANNGGGKMIKNVKKELENGGNRDNTQRVRINRLEKQKKENPELFAKNGGNEMVRALKSSVGKESAKQKSISTANSNKDTLFGNFQSNDGKGHHKEEGTVYYY